METRKVKKINVIPGLPVACFKRNFLGGSSGKKITHCQGWAKSEI